MALTHICCPHCEKEIRLELHVGKADGPVGRGPIPVYLGSEVEDLITNGIEVEGKSYREIATILMQQGIKTPRGGDLWYPASVQRQYRKVLLRRVDEADRKAKNAEDLA